MEQLFQEPSADMLKQAKEWCIGNKFGSGRATKIIVTDVGVWIWREFWQPAYEEEPEWGWEHFSLLEAQDFSHWPGFYWSAEKNKHIYEEIQSEISVRLKKNTAPMTLPKRASLQSDGSSQMYKTPPSVYPNLITLVVCVLTLLGGSYFFQDAIQVYARGASAFVLPEQSVAVTYGGLETREHVSLRAKFVSSFQSSGPQTSIGYHHLIDQQGKQVTVMLEHATESSVSSLQEAFAPPESHMALVTWGTNFAYVPALITKDGSIVEGFIGSQPNDSGWWFLVCVLFLLMFGGIFLMLVTVILYCLFQMFQTMKVFCVKKSMDG